MKFKSIKEFIDYIINFDNIQDILNSCQIQSERGLIFERLYDVIIIIYFSFNIYL
jgi:hypothetical protein